jgi:hypothetical protein
MYDPKHPNDTTTQSDLEMDDNTQRLARMCQVNIVGFIMNNLPPEAAAELRADLDEVRSIRARSWGRISTSQIRYRT